MTLYYDGPISVAIQHLKMFIILL